MGKQINNRTITSLITDQTIFDYLTIPLEIGNKWNRCRHLATENLPPTVYF